MIRLGFLLSLVTVLYLPGGAQAQSLGFQDVDFSGDVSLGVSSSDAHHGNARVDALLSLGLFDIDERPLAIEIGTFAYFIPGDRPHETYAALAFDDRWRLGVMRPAYDLVIPSVFGLTAPAVAEPRAEYVRATTTTEAMRFNSVPIGLSYTEDHGDYLWGVSVHDADDGDFRAASAAMQLRDGSWQWSVAVEGVWDRRDNFQGMNAKLGGRYTADGWDIGLAYLHPDANARPDALAFDVAYELSPELTLMTFGEITENGRDDAYGLGAGHQIAPDTEMIASVTDTRIESAFHLTFTRHF